MLVEIEASATVRIVRFNHAPENRFSLDFVGAINQALDQIEADKSARSIVFTSALEKYFSNGLDLSWIITQPNDVWSGFLIEFDRLLHRVFVYPKPTVAAMNGHAFAGGLFFALACDWRVMRGDRGWCCIPEIDLGLDLPPGNIALIAHVIGTRNADFYGLSGARLTAAQALGIGMIDQTAEKDQVLPRALETAEMLGAKKTEQYRRHKLGLRARAARVLLEDDPPFIAALVKDKQKA